MIHKPTLEMVTSRLSRPFSWKIPCSSSSQLDIPRVIPKGWVVHPLGSAVPVQSGCMMNIYIYVIYNRSYRDPIPV